MHSHVAIETGSPELKRSIPLPDCIAADLVDVEATLNEQMQTSVSELKPLFDHSALLGGKRFRPALVLLSGKVFGPTDRRHIVLGSVIELIHTATLMHDDVLDEADQRRHMPTVYAKWNAHTSILLGDYLFAQAFGLSASLGSTRLCQVIAEASKRVCEGEMRQCSRRDSLSLGEEAYYDILRGKTAELCRVSCELGAGFSGATEQQQEALGRYGENLGIAFQIADDWMDFWGDSCDTGKTLGTDIGQGKATLPLIRMLAVRPDLISDVQSILTIHPELRVARLRNLLDRCDAEAFTISKAREFAINAAAALDEFPASEVTETLRHLAEFSVSRSF